jgi:predicted enzyme related to lactoylglutathione lyase
MMRKIQIEKLNDREKFMIFRRLFAGIGLAVILAACTTASKLDLGSMTFADDPLVGKMVWHDLITEDLAAARRFYGGLFGWTFEEADGGRGQDYVVAISDGVYVAGMVSIEPPDDEHYSRWLPYMSVKDVDDAVSRSVAAGASVAVSARNVNFGRVAALVDPQGAVIGLVRSSIGDPDDRTTSPAPGRSIWHELLANDTQAASAFYQSLVGYTTRKFDREAGQYTLLAGNGVYRAGLLKKPDGDQPPLWLTFFGVKDPVAAADLAVSLGGSIILPVSKDLRNGTAAVVTDPTGAILVLQEWSQNNGGAE